MSISPKQGRFPDWFKKFIGVVFKISSVLFLISLFYKLPLPEQSEVIPEIKNGAPVQSELPANQKEKIITKIGGYEYVLTPLYSYELSGLVVTDYKTDNFLDVSHKNDPGNIKDICVIWGENVKNGSYREVGFSSGEFSCQYRWNKWSEKEFSGLLLSNNHLVPKDAEIAKKIDRSQIGDQVKLKGYLVNYEVYVKDQLLFNRHTSTTRDDGAMGACEIIYVTDFEIVKNKSPNFSNIKKIFSITSLSSGVLGLLLFLVG